MWLQLLSDYLVAKEIFLLFLSNQQWTALENNVHLWCHSGLLCPACDLDFGCVVWVQNLFQFIYTY